MAVDGRKNRNSRLARALLGVAVLLGLASIAWSGGAGATSPGGRAQQFKPTNTTWAPVSTGTIGRLCGSLVYLRDKRNGVKDIGLKACNSNRIYIFYRHPRDLVPFYQFRDASVGTGLELCDKQFGCLDNYLINFKNYIGLESCDECGKQMLPTWTTAPLTPYTPTPPPPTPTPFQPSPTVSFTPTLAPWQATETPGLFELLQGTPTAPTETALPPTQLPALSPSPSPGAPASALGRVSRSPLFLGVIFLAFGLLLAYLAWRSLTQSDHD